MPLSSADILWNRYIFSFLLPFILHSANLTPIDDACNKQYLTEGESWGTLLSSSKVVRVMWTSSTATGVGNWEFYSACHCFEKNTKVLHWLPAVPLTWKCITVPSQPGIYSEKLILHATQWNHTVCECNRSSSGAASREMPRSGAILQLTSLCKVWSCPKEVCNFLYVFTVRPLQHCNVHTGMEIPNAKFGGQVFFIFLLFSPDHDVFWPENIRSRLWMEICGWLWCMCPLSSTSASHYVWLSERGMLLARPYCIDWYYNGLFTIET